MAPDKGGSDDGDDVDTIQNLGPSRVVGEQFQLH